ncbi:hypothetical protein B0H13DRAFT_1882880 [Mycena leptocephala]|nr:hypothetical protein B0H13DRAFT_1882880 [Mycena leptocephala]
MSRQLPGNVSIRNLLSAETEPMLMCLGCWSQRGLINDEDMKAVTKLPTIEEEDLAEEKRKSKGKEVARTRYNTRVHPRVKFAGTRTRWAGSGNCAGTGTGTGTGTGGGLSTRGIPVVITRGACGGAPDYTMKKKKAKKGFKERGDVSIIRVVMCETNHRVQQERCAVAQRVSTVARAERKEGAVAERVNTFTREEELAEVLCAGLEPLKTFLGRITGVAERLLRFYQDTTIRAEKAQRGEIMSDSAYGSTSTALPANSDVTCQNCGAGGNTKARCWHRGGDIEGQYPDWLKGMRGSSTALIPRSNMAYSITL